jgi:hypothetical protein
MIADGIETRPEKKFVHNESANEKTNNAAIKRRWLDGRRRNRATEYLSALMSWGWLLDRAERQIGKGAPFPDELVVELENAKTLAVKTYAGVLVVANKGTRREIEYGFYDHLEVHNDYAILGKLNETNYEKLDEAQDWVRRRARDELGIHSIADSDPSL